MLSALYELGLKSDKYSFVLKGLNRQHATLHWQRSCRSNTAKFRYWNISCYTFPFLSPFSYLLSDFLTLYLQYCIPSFHFSSLLFLLLFSTSSLIFLLSRAFLHCSLHYLRKGLEMMLRFHTLSIWTLFSPLSFCYSTRFEGCIWIAPSAVGLVGGLKWNWCWA